MRNQRQPVITTLLYYVLFSLLTFFLWTLSITVGITENRVEEAIIPEYSHVVSTNKLSLENPPINPRKKNFKY